MAAAMNKREHDYEILSFYGYWPYSWRRIREDHESVTFMLKKDNTRIITLRW